MQLEHSQCASFASFCDVWWIPNPILEALLMNSDCTATAASHSSDFELLLGPLGPDTDGNDFFSLSAMPWNSCVRSRNDNCAVFIGILKIPPRPPKSPPTSQQKHTALESDRGPFNPLPTEPVTRSFLWRNYLLIASDWGDKKRIPGLGDSRLVNSMDQSDESVTTEDLNWATLDLQPGSCEKENAGLSIWRKTFFFFPPL